MITKKTRGNAQTFLGFGRGTTALKPEGRRLYAYRSSSIKDRGFVKTYMKLMKLGTQAAEAICH